jgi:ATP-dependent helicase/nuclease subunit B
MWGISMSLQFILGRSGSGKTTACLNEIRKRLMEEPNGQPIIYLVPEQMTFQSEYALINTPGLGGMIRAQVFSFTRLAWRVLQETGGMSRYHLSNVGLRMLLRKIIEHRKHELKLFGRAADKIGFLEQLEEMIVECKRYCLTPEQILEKQEELRKTNEKAAQKVLADKLSDLQLVYSELEKELINKYIDSEDYLRLLAEKISQSRYLANAHIYVDGFHSFTPQEYMVLEQLMIHCKQMTVALTVDAPYNDEVPDELHLFKMTGQTYHDIREMALLNNVPIQEIKLLQHNVRHQEKALAHLEKHYDCRPVIPFVENTNAIQIYQAVNRRAEVEGIAREIIRLVRDDGYRYRDIAVLVRNTNDYRDLFETIFADYHIAYFTDEKQPMLHHPLMELLRSSLEVIVSNWRYEAVFRAVKTDFLFPADANVTKLREAMDQLENYVLAYGIQGQKWTSNERWTYRRYQALEGISLPQTNEEKEYEEMLNGWREMIVKPLFKLQKRLKKAENGREMCEAIYLYLEELDIPKKLERLRSDAEAKGRLTEARQHDQVWNAMIDLLDQYVEILGNEKLPLKQFAKVIETGLDSLEFSQVPPAIDQVLIANFDRSRLLNIKCVFVVGFNEGVIPAKPIEDGVLTANEREILQQFHLKVAPGSREQLLNEPFAIYLALTTPSERLYITYALANEEGKALAPSIMLKRLTNLFPSIEQKQWGNEPVEAAEEEQLSFVTNSKATLAYLVTQLQAWKRNYPISDLWWDVYNYYAENDEWNKTARRVLAGLFYQNAAKKLKKDISKQLYGKKFQTSVSRMEQFKACPFSHFAAHGLRLKERKMFRLEAPDIGQLFHSALKHISDRINEAKLEWSKLSKQQCEQLSLEAVEQIAPKIQQEILLSSNRYYYMKRKLQNIISRTTIILSEHARASGFAPVGLELEFGPNGVLPPVTFQLSDGTVMELVGRIDRVDKAESSKGMLLRVIDYKSSTKALNLTEVYYGIALQMLTYLDIVITYAEQLVGSAAFPAGILYFHIHNPIIKSDKLLLDEKEAEKKLFEQFKMRGLLLGDEEAVRLMDRTMEEGKWSLIVPAQITKKGGFHAKSSIVSEEDFYRLRLHIRNLFQSIGTDIANGVVDISPYKLSDKTPCQFCSFKSVCQFDDALEENQYRLLIPQSKNEIIGKIAGGDGGNE